jgi:prostaglandin-E synthase
LFITIKVKECKDADVRLFAEGRISFKGSSTAQGEKHFAMELDLFAGINPDLSVTEVKTGVIALSVIKEESGDHWPRLIKDGSKNNRISVDFARYIDQEDEEREQQQRDLQKLKDELDGVGGDNSKKVSIYSLLVLVLAAVLTVQNDVFTCNLSRVRRRRWKTRHLQ